MFKIGDLVKIKAKLPGPGRMIMPGEKFPIIELDKTNYMIRIKVDGKRWGVMRHTIAKIGHPLTDIFN